MLRRIASAKGQLTLTSTLHTMLDIGAGDRLVFAVLNARLTARVSHARDINDLFAALLGVKAYAGAAGEGEAFHEELAEPHIVPEESVEQGVRAALDIQSP